MRRRLDRINRQLDRVDRDVGIVAETLALYVRYHLTITPPLPLADQGAARALGRDRFELFVAQVGRRVASGNRLVAEILERLSAGNPDLFNRSLDDGVLLSGQTVDADGSPATTRRAGSRSILRPVGRRSAMSDLLSTITRERRRNMLRTAMGPAIAQALDEPDVVEVLVNPDGHLWLDRHGSGRAETDVVLTPHEAERIIRLVASHIRAEASSSSPIVSAELPETGERFEGLLPPVTLAPCFAIRKPAGKVLRLKDYVAAEIMTPFIANALVAAVEEGRNILIAGGTGSGKTTLANALLAEVAALDQRVVIIEDTRELQCAAKDVVTLRTKAGVATLADLVRSTLRLRPDRIIVGEVRGAEALEMLKAWNTRPSGRDRDAARQFGTLRALPPRAAHSRSRHHGPAPAHRRSDRSHRLHRRPRRGRRVETVAVVEGLAGGEYRARTSIPMPPALTAREGAPRCPNRSPAFLLSVDGDRGAPLRPLRRPGGRFQHAVGGAAQAIFESSQGPVARIVAVIIIIVTGLTLAFGETSGGFRRLVQIVFGLSIAFAATSFFLTFFSFGGGALV